MRIEEITPEILIKANDKELKLLRERFLQLWGKYFKSNLIEQISSLNRNLFIFKYKLLKKEMMKRDLFTVNDISSLDEHLVVKGTFLFDVPEFGDIVITPNYCSVAGSYIKNPKEANDVDIIIKREEDTRDKELELKIRMLIKKETKKEVQFIYSPAGAQSSHIPIFDLILRAKNETRKIEVKKTGKKETITKPETTDQYHHIPVNPNCKITATITISVSKGIKATYCGAIKKIHTYIFDVKKWSMEEAKAWVKENYKKIDIESIIEKEELAYAKFVGSPKNPYNTHCSFQFKGGIAGYKRAWRVHFSQVGGGALSPHASGPIRGTVRRVAMIAAGMKPSCAVVDSEKIGARAGAESPLSGNYPQKPSDYGLSRWKKPSDEDIDREKALRFTCNDLNIIKRAATAEVKRRIKDRKAKEKKGISKEEEDFFEWLKELEVTMEKTELWEDDVLEEEFIEEKQEKFNCECIECGYKMISDKHCIDIKCPECGGKMRRVERPGPGKEMRLKFVKIDKEQQIVGGVVYEPMEVDLHEDFASAEDIRDACYDFMENVKIFKLSHKGSPLGNKIRILENYLAPADLEINKQMIKKGSWLLVLKIVDKKIWQDVKEGKINAFSMAGRARRKKKNI